MLIKAISIREPWASAIINLGKDVENRNWKTQYRGKLYIHASKTFDFDGWKWIQDRFGLTLPAPKQYRLGGIIGRVDLVDCVKDYNSKWFFGEYGFVLKNPEAIKFVPCKGQLNIFDVSIGG